MNFWRNVKSSSVKGRSILALTRDTYRQPVPQKEYRNSKTRQHIIRRDIIRMIGIHFIPNDDSILVFSFSPPSFTFPLFMDFLRPFLSFLVQRGILKLWTKRSTISSYKTSRRTRPSSQRIPRICTIALENRTWTTDLSIQGGYWRGCAMFFWDSRRKLNWLMCDDWVRHCTCRFDRGHWVL